MPNGAKWCHSNEQVLQPGLALGTPTARYGFVGTKLLDGLLAPDQ